MSQSAIARLRAEAFLSPRFPLRVMDVEHGAVAEHCHEFWEVVYVRRGRGEHRIEGRPYPLATGHAFVIRPGQCHAYGPRAGEAVRIVNVLWMPSLVQDTPPLSGTAQAEPLVRLPGRAALRVESLLDEMRREQAALAAEHEALLRHLFGALMILLARAACESAAGASTCGAPRRSAASCEAERDVVERAAAWIEANASRPVRLGEVASHVALSPSRLSHVFKAHTGRGVIEYLHEQRVARAAALLGSTRMPSAQVAREVGFGDARFFRRAFARRMGCSPADFRRHFAGPKESHDGEI